MICLREDGRKDDTNGGPAAIRNEGVAIYHRTWLHGKESPAKRCRNSATTSCSRV